MKRLCAIYAQSLAASGHTCFLVCCHCWHQVCKSWLTWLSMSSRELFNWIFKTSCRVCLVHLCIPSPTPAQSPHCARPIEEFHGPAGMLVVTCHFDQMDRVWLPVQGHRIVDFSPIEGCGFVPAPPDVIFKNKSGFSRIEIQQFSNRLQSQFSNQILIFKTSL